MSDTRRPRHTHFLTLRGLVVTPAAPKINFTLFDPELEGGVVIGQAEPFSYSIVMKRGKYSQHSHYELYMALREHMRRTFLNRGPVSGADAGAYLEESVGLANRNELKDWVDLSHNVVTRNGKNKPYVHGRHTSCSTDVGDVATLIESISASSRALFASCNHFIDEAVIAAQRSIHKCARRTWPGTFGVQRIIGDGDEKFVEFRGKRTLATPANYRVPATEEPVYLTASGNDVGRRLLLCEHDAVLFYNLYPEIFMCAPALIGHDYGDE